MRQPPTDVNRYYLRLASSTLGQDPRFHAANFARQPMRQILAAISWLNEEEQRRANIASHTTAHLATLVVAAASGGKCESDPSVFLPFLEQKLPSQVIQTIRDLIKKQRLPIAVVAMLSDDIRHAIKQET